MSKSYEEMNRIASKAKGLIVDALMQYVLEKGEDFHDSYDYYRNEYGIDEEETEPGVKVLKIIDIRDSGGCYFPWTELYQVDDDCGWRTYAFICLYVVEEDGIQSLKYYLFENDGTEYDEDASEPDHDYVKSLPFQVFDKLIDFIEDYDNCLK